MRIFCWLFIATALATLLFLVKTSAKVNKDQEFSQWNSKANQMMDICSPGSPPFRLAEEVRVWTKEDQWVDGTYTLIWNSPDQWRDEITLPNYHEIRVGGHQSIWFLRSPAHWTAAALHAWPVASVPRITPRAPKNNVKRIYETRIGGMTAHCFSGKPIASAKAEDCFDSDRSFFLSSTDTAASGMMKTEFSDYFRLGEHFIPRQRHEFRNGQLIGEAIVRDASLTHATDPGTFAPPPGAMRIGGCQKPVAPKPIAIPNPAYTPEARKAKVSGTVTLDIQIDEHGSIEDAAVVESLDPSLDGTVVETIKKSWRFEPATCSGNPVPFETVVEVDFRRFAFL